MSSKETNKYKKLNIKQKSTDMSENNTQELNTFQISSRYRNNSFNKKIKIIKCNEEKLIGLKPKSNLANSKQSKNDETLKNLSQISNEENNYINNPKEPEKNNSNIFSLQALNNSIKKSDVQ